MAQHDYVISNAPGVTIRGDLNDALAAIVTRNSGATEPATTYAGMIWLDTTANLVKRRNAANNGWIVEGSLDESFFLSRSSDTILTGKDRGKILNATGSYTQTLAAAATLGDGWFIDIIVDSGATLTIDPNSTETVDGGATKVIVGPAQGRLVCTISAFRTIGFVAAAVPVAGDLLQIATDTDPGSTTASTSMTNLNSGNKTITPKSNASKILITVTFRASIGNVASVNATGTFQIYDATNSVLVGSSYQIAAPSGPGGNGANAPGVVRAIVSNAVLTSRAFQLRGQTSDASGAAGASLMVWSFEEIKT